MRTLIDIEDKLLKEAFKVTGAATKKEVVNISLKELLRRSHIMKLKSKLGTGRFDLDFKKLKKLRAND